MKIPKYIAKIYLKQGFYNYIIATKDSSGNLNFGEINGSFWQTENLYQAFTCPSEENYVNEWVTEKFRSPIR